MKSIRHSLALSAASSYITFAFQIMTTVVIARLLTPEQIGTFAVAAVFTALVGAFRNFGITEYLIQEPELKPETVRAALAVNIIVSWSLGSMLALAAGAIARWYRHPEIATVIYIQASSFLLIPFGAITLAYLRRELDLKPVLVTGIFSNAVSALTGISLAWAGIGVTSLAWSGFAGVVASVLGAMWYRPATLPRWPSLKGASKAFRFGRYASGMYLFEQLGKGAPEMIIGRTIGIVPVAYFSRAAGVLELFDKLILNAVWPIVLPLFSKRQREGGRVSEAFMAATSYLLAVGWPVLAVFAVLAWPAIRIVYGDQWVPAVPLTPILVLAMALLLPYHLTKEALIAVGRMQDSTRLLMITHSLRVAGLLAGVPFGLEGACWGVVVAALLGVLLAHRALHGLLQIDLRVMLRMAGPCALITAGTVAPVAAITWAWPPGEHNFVRIALAGSAAAAAGWLLSARAVGHPVLGELRRAFAALQSKLA